MTCNEAVSLVPAELDGEIQAADRDQLTDHISECPQCRATADALRSQDADLRRAFMPRRAAANAIANRVLTMMRPAVPQGHSRIPWVPIILAAAAGFLFAVLVFQPWKEPPVQIVREPGGVRSPATSEGTPIVQSSDSMGKKPAEPPGEQNHSVPQLVHGDQPLVAPADGQKVAKPVAQLAFAKGAIEVLAPGEDAWSMLATNGAVAKGTRVRTDLKGRCEFVTAEGSMVRLNGETELVFHNNRKLELIRGQLWSTVAKDEEPYEVGLTGAHSKVTALGTQFDIACGLFETVLTVFEGSTKVDGKGGEQVVRVGESAKIVDGTVTEKHRVHDLVIATSWVHEILKLKGGDDEELSSRLNHLLAQIGELKVSHMVEKEILAFGDHCVLPLTRFIQSEGSKRDRPKRVRAAQILMKIAQPWSVPDLINLLSDSDGEVRFYADKALERLTDGVTHGLAAQEWRDAPADRRAEALQNWRVWWKENKDSYPSPP